MLTDRPWLEWETSHPVYLAMIHPAFHRRGQQQEHLGLSISDVNHMPVLLPSARLLPAELRILQIGLFQLHDITNFTKTRSACIPPIILFLQNTVIKYTQHIRHCLRIFYINWECWNLENWHQRPDNVAPDSSVSMASLIISHTATLNSCCLLALPLDLWVC